MLSYNTHKYNPPSNHEISCPGHFCHVISCVWLAIQNYQRSASIKNYINFIDPGALVIPVLRDDEVARFRKNPEGAENLIKIRLSALESYITYLEPKAVYLFNFQDDNRFTIRKVKAFEFVIPSCFAKVFVEKFMEQEAELAKVLSVISGDVNLCRMAKKAINDFVENIGVKKAPLALDIFTPNEISTAENAKCLRYLPLVARYRYATFEYYLAKLYGLARAHDHSKLLSVDVRVNTTQPISRYRLQIEKAGLEKINALLDMTRTQDQSEEYAMPKAYQLA